VQFVDSVGVPLAGGQLFSYDAGTLTLHGTFSDAALTVPNTNPVVLDAGGRAVIYTAAANFKFILKNSLGATIWTQDNVPAITSYNVVQAAVAAAIAAAAPNSLTTAVTGTVTGFALPTGTGPLLIRCNNTALLTIKGIVPGVVGQRLVIMTINTGQVDFTYLDAGAPVVNRILTGATVGRTSLAAGGVAEFVYDPSQTWYLVSHEQGSWITAPYNVANYVGNGALTWTPTGPQVQAEAYYLKGRMLTISVIITGSPPGGTTNNMLELLNTGWGGYVPVTPAYGAIAYLNDNGTLNAVAAVHTASTFLGIQKSDASNFAIAAGGFTVFFTFTFQVT
jgi:hypothetical protein